MHANDSRSSRESPLLEMAVTTPLAGQGGLRWRGFQWPWKRYYAHNDGFSRCSLPQLAPWFLRNIIFPSSLVIHFTLQQAACLLGEKSTCTHTFWPRGGQFDFGTSHLTNFSPSPNFIKSAKNPVSWNKNKSPTLVQDACDADAKKMLALLFSAMTLTFRLAEKCECWGVHWACPWGATLNTAHPGRVHRVLESKSSSSPAGHVKLKFVWNLHSRSPLEQVEVNAKETTTEANLNWLLKPRVAYIWGVAYVAYVGEFKSKIISQHTPSGQVSEYRGRTQVKTDQRVWRQETVSRAGATRGEICYFSTPPDIKIPKKMVFTRTFVITLVQCCQIF